MKNALTFLTLLMFSISFVSSQEVIENTENPLNPNAGRVLKIKEVFRISDESGEFYFKYPGKLKVSPDGEIFISDANQFLKFDENGNFIQNFFKKGQGPGEFSYIGNYWLDDEKIIIHNTTPNKLVWLDLDGNLLNEYTIHHDLPRGLNFVVFYNGYYFTKFEMPDTEGKFELVDS
ncbi:MAG: 6-bladed beta-propeller, partial [Candidatus Aminicenantes bacterium]|nr:6-bladed beta-propeller [Candidatus Aminicenantes bacterium]